jgi:anti-sigma regulatory factor (Ser/Thr protein kinase)
MSEAVPQQSGTRIAFSFPAEAESISEIRHLIVSEARTVPFTVEDLDDIALAVSEAFTNLVQYAPGYRIRGSCIINAKQLEVRFEVEQNIARFLGQRQFPSGLSHSGRGIPLLNLLIPTVDIQQQPDGTWELSLIKPVPDNEEKA